MNTITDDAELFAAVEAAALDGRHGILVADCVGRLKSRLDTAERSAERLLHACNTMVDALADISRMTLSGELRDSLAAFWAARDAAQKALDDVPMYLTDRTVKA